MKRTKFFVAYALTLAVGVFLYLRPFGSGLADLFQDERPYLLSIGFGVIAFTMFANQFWLASRPKIAIQALGVKGLLSFHAKMPVLALCIAIVHWILKIYVIGFSDKTLQAGFGIFSLMLLLIVVLLAAFWMANTFWLRIAPIKSLKNLVLAKLHLDYRKLRIIHNITVLASFTLLFHVLSASTADFQANPLVSFWMGAWMFFCLISYLRYRIKGRRPGSLQ